MTQTQTDGKDWILLYYAWFISLVATLGSLFFSDIMEFVPCTLCWYQRIAMYPLVIILLLGILVSTRSALLYALPFVILGWLMSFYHNLLHYGIVPESASPCVQGVPCSTKYIEWLGFLTIPMLSFISFSLIAILLYLFKKRF